MSAKVLKPVAAPTLSAGIGTRVQFQLGGKLEKLKTSGVLAGMIHDEHVMIRIPPIPGILDRLNEGDPVVVRYIYAGKAYGFNSTILAFTNKPALIVFLAYPDEVESVNLRETQRVPCCLSAKIVAEGGGYKAVIEDISLGGCRACLEDGVSESSSLDIDQMIELAFHLDGVAKEQVISCTIRNLKKDAQLYQIGIQFDKENETVLKNVEQYIENLTSQEGASRILSYEDED
jgi:c-di-GMP-binding flagellar brake protein YcgR